MRAVGLDVGSKTIGVAVSDELGLAAHPRETLARTGTASDVAATLKVIQAVEAAAVVVGIPYELSGREGVDTFRGEVNASVTRRVRLLLESRLSREARDADTLWQRSFTAGALLRF